MCSCLVCGNYYYKTKYTRPEVSYHRFPRDENLRKRWLEVLGISQCSIWHNVCSDHFLEENYNPEKKRRILFPNTIPQPCNQNGFPNNYTIQINDVETGNNAVLPMEQNIITNEEDTGNTAVNSFNAQRQSGRKLKSATINDDVNYLPRPKIEVIKTDVKPVLTATKDHTSGPRCSVKKCFNRHSKELSFFGYPRDLTLRKKWIAKSGLVVSPTATNIINRYKVCGVHFDDDCYKNIKLRNRLKPGTIPTLFVVDDIIESRNMPSKNSPENSGFGYINKPSSSTSNYVGNGDSKHTPSLEKKSVPPALQIPINAWQSASNDRNNLPDIMEARNFPSTSGSVHKSSTNCSTKDFYRCCIQGCISNLTNTDEKPYIFKPRIECVNEWSSALGMQLTVNSYICERHFKPQDLICKEFLECGLKKVIKFLVHYALPIPINAVPSASNTKNNLLDNTDKCPKSNTFMAIDDFPTIDPKLKQKLKNISAKNSLSITLGPIEKSKVVKPSVDLFLKTYINTPVISKCVSLARIPDTHNSNSNKNKPPSKTSSLINNMRVVKRH